MNSRPKTGWNASNGRRTGWYPPSPRTPTAASTDDGLDEPGIAATHGGVRRSGVLVPLAPTTLAQRAKPQATPEGATHRLDCDADVCCWTSEQIGGIACHTGRQSCFFAELRDGEWVTVDPVLKDPRDVRRMSDEILRELAATLETL